MRVVKSKQQWISVPTPADFTEKYSYNVKTGEFRNDTKNRVLNQSETSLMFVILSQEGCIHFYTDARGEDKWAFA